MNMREMLYTPRGFLMTGGVVLLVLGLIGFVALKDPSLSPTSGSPSFFWLDTSENYAHTALGIVALAAVFVPGLNSMLKPYYKWIVILVGLIALFFGLYGFVLPAGSPAAPNTFGLANLELGDNLIHLLVAAWAFMAAFWMQRPMMAK